MSRAENATIKDDDGVEVDQFDDDDGSTASGGLHKKPAIIADREDNEARVTPTGELCVVNASGAPIMGTEAAGENTYATVMVAGRECHNLSAYCTGGLNGDVVLSIDGGVTDALFVARGTHTVFNNLTIPKNATISARNGVAGTNYAALYVSIW